jgi:hypothetical protein
LRVLIVKLGKKGRTAGQSCSENRATTEKKIDYTLMSLEPRDQAVPAIYLEFLGKCTTMSLLA